jgi:YD repeat-containing protein
MTQDPGGARHFNYQTFHKYDPNGNETKLIDPKGQAIDIDYDELNRLKSKVYNLTAADLALFTRTHRIDYQYDPNDNLIRVDETKSAGTDRQSWSRASRATTSSTASRRKPTPGAEG